MSVLLISPAGTGGWRHNEEALAAGLGRLGVEHRVRRVDLGALERFRHPWASGSMLVAAGARRELNRGLREETPEAVIAVNPTAAMLFPFSRLRRLGIPVAIRIDCPAGEQFPGAAHALHRRLESRALGNADLALTMGPRSTAEVEPLARRVAEVPLGVEGTAPLSAEDPPRLLAYAAQPQFKGLDRILSAWGELWDRRGDATLVVTGLDPRVLDRYMRRHRIDDPGSVVWPGMLPRRAYELLLRRATAFVSASRLEGHGLAQLEALAAGVPLVTTPSLGAYEGELIARELAPELCAEPAELAGAMMAALEMTPEARAAYARRAAGLLGPFRAGLVDPALSEALSALGVPAPPAASPPPQSAG